MEGLQAREILPLLQERFAILSGKISFPKNIHVILRGKAYCLPPVFFHRNRYLSISYKFAGGRDRHGGPIVTFPAGSKLERFNPEDITKVLVYFSGIPRYAKREWEPVSS